MKKIISFALSLVFILTTFAAFGMMGQTVSADSIVNIPDRIFKTYLTQQNSGGKNFYKSVPNTPIDKNGDGEISVSEAEAVTELEIVVWGLKELDIQYYVKSIKGIEAFKNLTRFVMRGEKDLADLSPLAACTKLRYLHISDCEVSTLAPISTLTELNVLWIMGCKLTNMDNLATFTKLKDLKFTKNLITDVRGAADLPAKMTNAKAGTGITVYDNKIDCKLRSVMQTIDAIAYKYNSLGGLDFQNGATQEIYVSGIDPDAEASRSLEEPDATTPPPGGGTNPPTSTAVGGDVADPNETAGTAGETEAGETEIGGESTISSEDPSATSATGETNAPEPNDGGNNMLIIILIIGGVVVIGGGFAAWWFLFRKKS